MTILLFGISNVGKSTVGALLAHKLNFDFYDLDDEIKKKYCVSLEKFVSTGTLQERDKKRCRLLRSIVKRPENKVIAVTPLSEDLYVLKADQTSTGNLSRHTGKLLRQFQKAKSRFCIFYNTKSKGRTT